MKVIDKDSRENHFCIINLDGTESDFIPISLLVPDDMPVADYVKNYEEETGLKAEVFTMNNAYGTKSYCSFYILTAVERLAMPVFEKVGKNKFDWLGKIILPT
ncbi:MAG: hypothetical protein RBR08_14985 [Desulforegulaceae bacterium]|nr:hypothetical protein [Desulforegulaceae bacterium]